MGCVGEPLDEARDLRRAEDDGHFAMHAFRQIRDRPERYAGHQGVPPSAHVRHLRHDQCAVLVNPGGEGPECVVVAFVP